MTQSAFKHVKISGINAVVPKQEICLADELRYYGNDWKKIERMRKMVGFWKRRVAEKDVTASDMCIQAAQKLLARLNVSKDDIDALIFVVQNPDYNLPATACVAHQKLNLPQTCPAFDVNQGCAGYVYGLWLAFSLVESAQCRKVLLLAGDTASKKTDPRNRVTAPVFGDGGTATLIEFCKEENPSYFELGTDSSGCETIIVPAGGARIPFVHNPAENDELCQDVQNGSNIMRLTDIYMDAAAVFDFAMKVVPPHIKSLMAFANTVPERIDYLVLHQANKQIIQMVGTSAGFPSDKVPFSTVEKYGNQTIASIPCVLCDALSQKLSARSLNLLLCGFGIGMSWASCLICLRGGVDDITEFEHSEPQTSRNGLIKKWTNKLKGETK